MDRDALIDLARSAMADQRPHEARETGYVFHHGLRTARLAARLLERIDLPAGLPADLVFAGALFHDVGKADEPHNETGARRVAELLDGRLDSEQIALVARIVREHNQRDRSVPCAPESRVVQDADLLDHFGAQGVWLSLHWSAAHDRAVPATLAYRRGQEWRSHLQAHRDMLNFEASREAFDRRADLERRFFDRLAAESEGQL